MAGVAKDVRQEECKDVAVRPSPIDDLPVRSGAFAEVLLHELVEGQELNCAGGKAQERDQEDPAGDFGQRVQDARFFAFAAGLVRGGRLSLVITTRV